MDQMISLEGHLRFQPMIASAVLQVHPNSDVVADSSPLLTWLEIWNPAYWSKDDLPRFLALARELSQLILLIYLYFFLKGNS